MAHNSAEHLQERLDALPTKPGVYLMKDEAGQVIYVGKTVNLRHRVRSYFQPSTVSQRHSKTAQLVEHIADIEVIVVDSEIEALLIDAAAAVFEEQQGVRRVLLANQQATAAGISEILTVYTTRPDTLFGATYMVLAPEHPLVEVITTDEHAEEVRAYQQQAAH